MSQLLSDRRDVEFVLFDQMKLHDMAAHEKYSDFTKKTCQMVLSEARNLAIKEILPTLADGDKKGCILEDGQVRVPESFHKPFKLYREGEWIAMSDAPDAGGQGMPHLLTAAAFEYFSGANISFTMYTGLCHGTGKLVELFGTDKQKELFLEKLYTGQWGATMVLTESQAGTNVGEITTSAAKNDDGTWSITGNKIFITGGDHDLTENIIHAVLARIEGAPAGTKGISLFLAPKIWVNEDGSLGKPNDVVCTGIEEKMGIHGSSTCSLSFGSGGGCRGFLLGEENKGMRCMFHMMNEARLGVGLMGFSIASAAYRHALDYARERLQGKDLSRMADADAPQVPIIRHPDVRRMLLWMKAHVEGMRSFVYYIASLFDKSETADNAEEKEKYEGLIEILTPIVKAYCSDRAFEVCSQAVQVFGGYGYTGEYPVEQLLRDCKITSIYEGANGIQAMDLLGRKLGMKKGKPSMDLLAEMKATIAAAKETPEIVELAEELDAAVDKLGELAMHMGMTAMSPKVLVAFSFAAPFLEVLGDVIMAWMHLCRASLAAPGLKKKVGSMDPAERKKKAEKKRDVAFYEGIVRTAEYFIQTILPITLGKMASIQKSNDAVMEIPETSFGGK